MSEKEILELIFTAQVVLLSRDIDREKKEKVTRPGVGVIISKKRLNLFKSITIKFFSFVENLDKYISCIQHTRVIFSH